MGLKYETVKKELAINLNLKSKIEKDFSLRNRKAMVTEFNNTQC